ncbi:ribbon-helix-helix domain-containing protein [Nesterenkonia flava]|uniref:Type II toxin-antitoxin system ParD family antitoxin n=1 Tax=Nesterenkonia flava TaxID=469799 RepID=A0ABU1FT57_9MICC|nr:hypothetical protein [Nesterenkonia flava]MDR5711326.1 hypothetical protein [Nesterenkonia flava]
MATLRVSVPDELHTYVERRTVHGDYASAEEYFIELVRKDRERYESHCRALRQKVLEGMDSGAGMPWPAVRADARPSD